MSKLVPRHGIECHGMAQRTDASPTRILKADVAAAPVMPRRDTVLGKKLYAQLGGVEIILIIAIADINGHADTVAKLPLLRNRQAIRV